MTAERVDELPSALSGPEDDKECADTAADVYCHVCVKKNKTSKRKADMFCYNCNNVFCDDHAGVCMCTASGQTASNSIIRKL